MLSAAKAAVSMAVYCGRSSVSARWTILRGADSKPRLPSSSAFNQKVDAISINLREHIKKISKASIDRNFKNSPFLVTLWVPLDRYCSFFSARFASYNNNFLNIYTPQFHQSNFMSCPRSHCYSPRPHKSRRATMPSTTSSSPTAATGMISKSEQMMSRSSSSAML